MDVNGHLNNVAIATLFESGRVFLNAQVQPLTERPSNERTMVEAIEINYLAEGDFPDPVHIASGFGRLGGTSWTIIQAMFQNGRAIAPSDTDIVCRNDGLGKPLSAETAPGIARSMGTPAHNSTD